MNPFLSLSALDSSHLISNKGDKGLPMDAGVCDESHKQ
jgi:hypothetical protein